MQLVHPDLLQQVYNSALAGVTANGELPPQQWVLPWVHKGKFVRIPPYYDGHLGFGSATAMVMEDRSIRVRNSYGETRTFTDPQLAGQFLTEV